MPRAERFEPEGDKARVTLPLVTVEQGTVTLSVVYNRDDARTTRPAFEAGLSLPLGAPQDIVEQAVASWLEMGMSALRMAQALPTGEEER